MLKEARGVPHFLFALGQIVSRQVRFTMRQMSSTDVQMGHLDESMGPDVDRVESTLTDEDDDPIVREIDVYVNRISNPSASADDDESSGAAAYLLQYPLRPIYRPYGDQGRLVQIKHRVQQKTLQMHYTLNMESENFDPGRRAELLENHSRSDPDKPNSGVSHVLNSLPCVSPNSSFGLGLLQGDRLYVTPLSAVLQFRPDFSHVDGEEDRAKSRAEEHLISPSTTGGDTTPTTSAPSPKASKKDKKSKEDKIKSEPATVQPPHSSSSSNLAVNRSVAIPDEREWHRYPPSRVREFLMEEPWEKVDSFFDPDSIESHEILQLLTTFEVPIPNESSGEKEGSGDEVMEDRVRYKRVTGGDLVPTIQFSSDHRLYVDRLCSIAEPSEDGSTTNNGPAASTSGSLSYLSLSRLPIDQQVLRILQNRHVESFTRIKALLTKTLPDDELILHLRSYGEIILGNWVCKSALIYDGLVAHCRDLLLCLLAMEKPINREKVKPYVGNLSMEKLSDILKEVLHLCYCINS